MQGIGEALWVLLMLAMFAGIAVVVFVVGSIIGIWVPIPAWQLTLAALGGAGLICLVFVAVYRP